MNVMVSPGPSGQGTTWSQPFSVSAGTLLSYNSRDFICPPGLISGCVQGRSMHMTRYNNVDGSLELVWHQRKPSPTGTNSRVVLRKFQYNAGANTGTFSNEVVISDRINDDQWQPAIDLDHNGTCLVSYYDYDHADSSTAVKYRIYGRKVNADGTAIAGEFDTRLYSSAGPSDVTQYTSFTTNIFSPPVYTYYILGEYEDVWYRSGKWNNAGVYILPGMNKGDIIVNRPQ
jgi:hypothetical protein